MMKCCMLDLSINYRQLAQRQTSPLWALWVRGNDTTSLTYFRELNYTSNRSSCDVQSLGNENLYCRQTSSCKQSWAATSSAHDFSNVTKNTTNESPEIQCPIETLGCGKGSITYSCFWVDNFKLGQNDWDNSHADFVCSLENYLILNLQYKLCDHELLQHQSCPVPWPDG